MSITYNSHQGYHKAYMRENFCSVQFSDTLGNWGQIQETPWLRPSQIQLYSGSVRVPTAFLHSTFSWAFRAFRMSRATCSLPGMPSYYNHQHLSPLTRIYNLDGVFLAFSSFQLWIFQLSQHIFIGIPLKFASTSLSVLQGNCFVFIFYLQVSC